ncbi:hypothetical protein F4820DRAFT_77312 [Hypoxylon rubiginosum]|uniref:Uncharacterized protein n=1 Tax=Hypoxylon rubiginosum TaxID=110542 RepID=A0ACB9ZBR3_9PEZI|nr:hypothetical protein F4820DRAFT_77312 [Hypoxylon rubiginosum]
MQGAILNGLYTINAPLSFRCPTGTCVWPDFTTLAATSHCHNATLKTNITCQHGTHASHQCNYTTPSGLLLQTESHQSSDGGYSSKFNSIAEATSNADDCAHYDKDDGTLALLATAKIVRDLEQPEIMECKVEWSARRYRNFSVKNGKIYFGDFDELPLSYIDYRQATPDDYKNGGFGPSCLLQFAAAFDRRDIKNRDRHIFAVNPADHRRIGASLARIFSSSDRDEIGRVLYHSPSIEGTVHIHNITESMTYMVGDSHSATQVAGDAIASEQFISVSWQWITLLVVEVLMGLALLALTVQLTEREDVVSWKSSALVSFFVQAKGWEENLSDTSVRGIENISRRMHGSIQFDKGAPMFVRVDE